MFERLTPVTTRDLEDLVSELGRVGGAVGDAVDDAGRIELVTALERAKSAIAAAQARITADFAASQKRAAADLLDQARSCSDSGDFEGYRACRDRARESSLDGALSSVPGHAGYRADADSGGGDESGDGVGRSAMGKRRRTSMAKIGVYAQIGLARRESPARGSRYVRLALALTERMPCVMSMLAAGTLSEWRAQIIVEAVAVLSPEDQQSVDAGLGLRGADVVGSWGDELLRREIRAMVAAVDAEAILKRREQAESDRRVSSRAAPDGMAYLTAFLPAADAVRVYAHLGRDADVRRAKGDERGRGQLMADLFAARVTGVDSEQGPPVELQLIITEEALLADSGTAADEAPGGGDESSGNHDGENHDGENHDGENHDGCASGGSGSSSDVGPAPDGSLWDPGASSWKPGAGFWDRVHTQDLPAHLLGYGPVPGSWARAAVATASQVTIRRVKVDPRTGELTGVERGARPVPERVHAALRVVAGDHSGLVSPSLREWVGHEFRSWRGQLGPPRYGALTSPHRLFQGRLRAFVALRDGGLCRTPWCSAPVRHIDHVRRSADGGPTIARNGQGLCVRCNLVKELAGWAARVDIGADGRHRVVTRTPTGAEYTSVAPAVLPGLDTAGGVVFEVAVQVDAHSGSTVTYADSAALSPVEEHLRQLLAA